MSSLDKFYEKKFFFSYSSINKLLYSPKDFYNYYILHEKEERFDKHLIEGKAVHCLLLEKNYFNEYFSIMAEYPSSSNKKIVEDIYVKHRDDDIVLNLSGYKKDMLKWLEDNNLHQSLKDDKKKTADQKRLDKVITERSISYFNFLIASQNKTVIDQDVYQTAKEKADLLRQDEDIIELMGLDSSFETLEVFNEEYIKINSSVVPYGYHGIIDNYKIDHSDKTITINDLKTTQNLLKFQESVEFWNYWIQAVIYKKLVLTKHPECEEYKINFNFIVIDRTNMYYPYPVSDETFEKWEKDFEEIVNKIDYHYLGRKYNLPYEFDTGMLKL